MEQDDSPMTGNENPTQRLLEQVRHFPSATLHEALGKEGALPAAIKPLDPMMKLCGTAVTIQTMPGDNLLLHKAIAAAAPGDVLVANVSGYYEAGYWGEIMTVGAQARGVAGLVIDGCVRDADPIEALGFPVFCRGLCIQGTTKFGKGSLNQPVVIGSITVHPGDIIVGDRDGVVVVPRQRLEEAIKAAQAREAKEEKTMASLRAGKTTMELYGWS